MTHPDRASLLHYAFEPAVDATSVVALHLRSCADCAAEVRQLKNAGGMLKSGSQAQQPGLECLDDDLIAALAEGTLDAAARAEALPHLARCARCRGAVTSVTRALADPTVAREVAMIDGAGRRRFYRIAGPAAAAAAALLMFVLPREGDDLRQPHRAPTITAGSAPVPMLPVGAVAGVERLRWAAVAGADRYRVVLFDAAGSVVYEREITDTVAMLPDSIILVPGVSYLWKVEARTGFDRWSTSELVQFSIMRRAPP